uniref:AAA+ ATPase domain-containing protein n=1 Tax=Oryza barthii TaxID=65489 RepID=A0A0D3FTR1_9ORYZ
MPSSAAAAADGGDIEEVDRLKKRIRTLEMEETKLNQHMERVIRGIEANEAYLVGMVLRIMEKGPEDETAEDDCDVGFHLQRKIIFRPIAGVVYPSKLKPGDLIGVDSTSNEHYCGIGGLEKQVTTLSTFPCLRMIEELVEAVVLPIIHKNCFQRLGIHPPKGVLLYGPPGTGKTLVAHAFASQTNATFLKLTGPQLAVKLIGEGARLVRDAFQLAKEKAPCIIFIDEIDAIGSKHFDRPCSGDREVQQTIVELLNQLDGVRSYESIKVIAATNRPEVLDPAFLRSGRLDQKIEFPHPSEQARIHSRKMDKNPDVNFEELACCTDDFNGAQLKAVCFEASMLAFHRDATEVSSVSYLFLAALSFL